MVGVFLVYVIFKNTINYLKFYSLKIFLHPKLYTFGCKEVVYGFNYKSNRKYNV